MILVSCASLQCDVIPKTKSWLKSLEHAFQQSLSMFLQAIITLIKYYCPDNDKNEI